MAGRVWTDEQRKAQGEVMRKAREKRWSDKHAAAQPDQSFAALALNKEEANGTSEAPHGVVEGAPAIPHNVVQHTATPCSDPKTCGAFCLGLCQRENFVLQEAEKPQSPFDNGHPDTDFPAAPPPAPLPPVGRRIGSMDYRIIVKTDGTMVSTMSPCICGAGKNVWHPVCLSPKAVVTVTVGEGIGHQQGSCG